MDGSEAGDTSNVTGGAAYARISSCQSMCRYHCGTAQKALAQGATVTDAQDREQVISDIWSVLTREIFPGL